MSSIGRTIQCLRKAKGVTQDQMAQQIGVSFQAISKWENEYTLPDILLLPVIADYFGISIDDLFQYKWREMNSKERLVSFMLKNGIIRLNKPALPYETRLTYHIISERFTTNLQLSAIGEALAETLRDNQVGFDGLVGLAYHGIAFAASAAMALKTKYGCTTHFCFDRLLPDRRGRQLCGYTPEDGDRIVVINDVICNGKETEERIEKLRELADVQIAAILCIAEIRSDSSGRKQLETKYNTRVYSLLTDDDIQQVLQKEILL